MHDLHPKLPDVLSPATHSILMQMWKRDPLVRPTARAVLCALQDVSTVFVHSEPAETTARQSKTNYTRAGTMYDELNAPLLHYRQ